jgi:arginase
MPFAIVEAPSILGLRPTGVDRLPDSLLRLGLADRLDARRAGRVEPPPYAVGREAATGTLNGAAIQRWSSTLADAVTAVVDGGATPLVLGGDCSILLGSLLALRRRGRYGLLFLDGHADFYQVEANPNGEAASMELAFATGRGPSALADLEGRGPLVRDDDVVAVGIRDAEEQAEYGSQPLPPPIRLFDLEAVRRLGVAGVAAAAIGHLTRTGLDGFFIHVDADVLADDVMQAVDYRLPGGLRPAELSALLRAACGSGRVAGVDVTIYNPALDADETAGRVLVDVLVDGLSEPRPRTARAAHSGSPRSAPSSPA